MGYGRCEAIVAKSALRPTVVLNKVFMLIWFGAPYTIPGAKIGLPHLSSSFSVSTPGSSTQIK